MPNVLFVTRGCAKNEVDTDRMRALLLGAGYDETDNPDKADIALINTCSFLVSATQESLDTTLELARQEEGEGRTLPIVMCGCV
ncbi:MAG: 30S ribosomal protein S12 methylthiotransferase RimO, partial [Olsenella sp.]|nr:30S ribosomal protein S12 methylthiotransferase RimO [Olsenella sp.]